MTPWTLLLLAASVGPECPAETVLHPSTPAAAAAVRSAMPRAWRPRTAVPAGSAGLRIDLDPERAPALSSELEQQALAAHESALAELRAEVLADGSLMLVVGDLLQSHSVVRFDAAGRRQFDCAHSSHEAARLSHRPLLAPVRVWEEK